MKRLGGLTEEDAWLAPNPGGAASWGLGYYPAGVKGVRLCGCLSAPPFPVRFSSVVVLNAGGRERLGSDVRAVDGGMVRRDLVVSRGSH